MDQKNVFRIVIVDDNPAIHSDISKVLAAVKNERASLNDLEAKIFDEQKEEVEVPLFEISTATQGQEGILLVSKAIKNNSPFALAFVDIRMPPGLDGIETIEKIWGIDMNIQ